MNNAMIDLLPHQMEVVCDVMLPQPTIRHLMAHDAGAGKTVMCGLVHKELRQRIRDTFDGETPKVLDPFAGGGSLPLEAARPGCEAHALDLNPVAVLTMLGTVDYPIRFAKAQFPRPPRPEDMLLLEELEKRTGNLVEAVKA